VDLPILAIERQPTNISNGASAHQFQQQGVSPPILPREPWPGFTIGLTGVHLSNDRTRYMGSSIRVLLSDNNRQAFLLHLLSLCFWNKWIEMRPPNQIFKKLFYSAMVNVLGFDSPFKMFLCFVFSWWSTKGSLSSHVLSTENQ